MTLQQERFKREWHDKHCYAVLDALEEIGGEFKNKIEVKKNLKRITSVDDLKIIHQKLKEYPKNDTQFQQMKNMLNQKTPIALLVEYIGAPQTHPDNKLETQQKIYNRLTKNSDRPTSYKNISGKEKFLNMTAYAAFSGSFSFASMALVSFKYPEVGQMLHSSLNMITQFVKPLVDHSDFVTTHGQSFALAAFTGYGLQRYFKQWKKYKSDPVDLHSSIAVPSNDLADRSFGGFHHSELATKINGISEADQALLSHLSPYELRAILTSPKNEVDDLLGHLRPSSEQVHQYLAKTQSFFGYMGHTMISSTFSENIQNNMVDALHRVGLLVPSGPVSTENITSRILQHRESKVTQISDNDVIVAPMPSPVLRT